MLSKINYVRDQGYLRWLSSLPCMKCGIEGLTQAAHLGRGGKGIKGHDSEAAPLCTVHNGELGCHEKLDQHIVSEQRYWHERMPEAKRVARKAYGLFKEGDIEQARVVIEDF